MLVDLREACEKMHEKLLNLPGVRVMGVALSPIKHLQLTEPSDDRDLDIQTLQMVVDKAMTSGVALTIARYLETDEHNLMPPSIRLTVNNELTDDEIKRAYEVISGAFNSVLSQINQGHGPMDPL